MTMNLGLFINIFIFLLVGLLYIFMPYLTRKTESFGIAIPEEIYHSERMEAIRKDYVKMASVVMLLVMIFSYLVSITIGNGSAEFAFITGILTLLLALFGVYLRFHFYVKRLKKEEQWIIGKKQVSVIDTSFRKRKLTYSQNYFIIPLIIVLASAIITWLNYDLIGDQIPMQFDFDGNPTSFRDKSLLSVFWPNISQIMLLGLFMFINHMIAGAKQHINPADPETSMLQNEIFRRKWSAFIIMTGYVMVIMFSVIQLSFIYDLTPAFIMIFLALLNGSILVGAIYLAITVGQGGSRVTINRAAANDQDIDRDLDEYWKLGQFYVNPDDPAVFIEKRFGIGWTINFGSKKGWLYLGLLLIMILAGVYFG